MTMDDIDLSGMRAIDVLLLVYVPIYGMMHMLIELRKKALGEEE